MNATKTKKSALAIGRKRGVPMRLVRAIARRYDLDKIVVWTADKAAGRPRELILTWGRSNSVALQASNFANAVACGRMVEGKLRDRDRFRSPAEGSN
jgi:hypothetical protein